MKKDAVSPARVDWKPVVLYGLLFLLFLQLVSDFIETIYAFGLLGVSIPPEIISVLLFFSPLALLPFRRGLPRIAVPILAVLAAAFRSLAVALGTGGKMVASGLGVGCLLVLLPLLLRGRSGKDKDASALELGAGLALGLAFSALLRALAAGSDLSTARPWLAWLLSAALIAAACWFARSEQREKAAARSEPAARPASFGVTAALCLGCLSAMSMLYFAFANPGVLARWSGADVRLVLLFFAAGEWLAFAALPGQLARVTRPALLAWNALFLLSGLAAILASQVAFPANPAAYPLDQPDRPLLQQIPLFLMILLAPVALIDFALLAREILSRKPSPRALAGGFSLGALFFLVVALAQVFTTAYDYIPVVGPWMRDRFWLAFLLPGLGMALPVLLARDRPARVDDRALRTVFLPVMLAALLAPVVAAVIAAPQPVPPNAGGPLRVVTYNVQQGYTATGQRGYQDQLEVLRALDPDIIGLQETDVARFTGGNADIVRTFADGLDMYSYYGPRTVTGTFGTALLSRYPIEDPRTFFMYSSGEQTAAIQARITTSGKTYTVLVTHLGNGGPVIQQQQVLERLAGEPNVVAMGDFNFRLATEQYQLTTQSLDDAWALAGSPTAPGLDLNDLIDHIFITPGTSVQSARYVVDPASDHPALLVEIK